MNRDTPQSLLADLGRLNAPDLPAARMALAIALFRGGAVSAGFAARIADLPLAKMLALLSSQGIAITGDGAETDVSGEMHQAGDWLVKSTHGQTHVAKAD